MQIKNISDAKAESSFLIEAVQRGEEVIIGKAGKPVAKVARIPGALRGRIRIAADFDDLPADITAAFGMQ